jgi:hypothetical protein
MKVQIGKAYTTKCGNKVELVERTEIHNPTGANIYHFTARVLKVIDGHQAFMRVHRYTEEGKWLNEDGQTVKGCIHDLKDEVK